MFKLDVFSGSGSITKEPNFCVRIQHTIVLRGMSADSKGIVMD